MGWGAGEVNATNERRTENSGLDRGWELEGMKRRGDPGTATPQEGSQRSPDAWLQGSGRPKG